MKPQYQIKIAVGKLLYIQIKSDLYKVFDEDNNYMGLAYEPGQSVFVK